MKIKSKLVLGIGFLFALIALLTALSSIFINKLSADTKNILVANYNTLDYCRNMSISLYDDIENIESKKNFQINLVRQQANVTEIGEKELTDNLSSDYNRLTQFPDDSLTLRSVQKDLTDVMLLNMQAIKRKSSVAQNTADNAISWVAVTGGISLLLAFTMLFNLPGNIANPIRELTKSIKEIAAQNYAQRLHFKQNSEFGQLASSFNVMAEKLQEYKTGDLDKLMVEKKRIETLINSMKDPVIGLDEKNCIVFMNETALKITSTESSSVIGVKIQDLAIHNDLIRLLARDLFTDVAINPEEKNLPLKIYADDKESYFKKSIIPINILFTGEKETRKIGTVILLQNITSYKELDFAKTHFIATISHELKTPIASIKMSLQLLENDKIGLLNTEQKTLLDSAKDDADRLLKITAELLNLAQVESGSIHLNVIPFEAKEMIDAATSVNYSAANQKKIKVIVSSLINLPKVLGDKDKTTWVLSNFISNAIRYSYEGSSVEITASEWEGKVKFSVIDFGQGIQPEFIDKIFERYYRIPGSKKEGTGLGLTISKEFIEAQGGNISVQSDFGGGSKFSFSLNKV